MKSLLAVLLVAATLHAQAAIKVVTSLPDLADFTRQVGGDKVKVDFIVQGNQNPHFVELKPSYMMKLKSADIFFEIGMELEMWAPQIIDGSRNASLDVVDLSHNITKLEVPEKVDASQGDVHRFGNPHYWLDPRNAHAIVNEIAEALSKHSPGDAAYFRSNADAYLKKLDARIAGWESAMKPFHGAKIVTFHKSWSYFANWLGLDVVAEVEPKPGIAPSPGHTAELISLVRQGDIKAIIVEPYYDTSAPEQIARSTSAKVLRLATSTGGADAAQDYLSTIDYDVNTLASALR